MINKKILFILTFVFVFVTFAFSQQTLNINDYLSSDIVEELNKKGRIESSVYGEDSEGYKLKYVPQTELGKQLENSWKNSGIEKEPVFVFEGLFLIKKENKSEPGADIKDISKLFRSISALEGVTYYSHSRKKDRELYKLSYAIKDAKTKEKIPDPIEGDNADGLSILVLQEDSTFGKFVYQYDYKQNENDILLAMKNIDPLSLIGFKIIDPEEFRLSLSVTDLGDSILMYALVQTDVMSVPMIENKIKTSLGARVEALYEWFKKEYKSINTSKTYNIAE